jgi:hypothetical protein
MRPDVTYTHVDADARFAKRVRGAALLAAVSPERSVAMAFELIRFAREINGAASSAPT